MDIKPNSKKITMVANDLCETRSRFEIFVEKADKILKTQRDAEMEIKEHLKLLKEYINEAKQDGNQPNLQKPVWWGGAPKQGHWNDEKQRMKFDKDYIDTNQGRRHGDHAQARRGADDRHLIDYHLPGLTLL